MRELLIPNYKGYRKIIIIIITYIANIKNSKEEKQI